MQNSFKFNPGFQTDDESIANFVVRQSELRQILERFRSESAEPRVIVVAPRGAGKTTLCRRVLAEVRRNVSLSARWMPLFLGEESYSVTTAGEFLLECLFHLADDPKSEFTHEEYNRALRIEGDKPLRTHCLQILAELAKKGGKRFLIIVENLHMIVRDQLTTSDNELLDILREDSVFGIMATAVRSDEEDDRLPGFEYLPLKPLNLAGCHELWARLTGQQVDKSRIRPLQILTGGSPRLLHILAEFMKTPSLRDLMENLNFLIDQNTEYFKSQLDALPSQERKVFVALLEAWDPSSAKQIAEAARVSVNTASALLNRLSDRGAVIKQAGTGRASLYQAAERLFNIYYLMRRRSHPSSRVRALVAFMTQYYDRDELVDTTAKIAIEACTVEPSSRSDYHSAFSAILKDQPEAIRSAILRRTPSDFLASLTKDASSPQFSLLPQMEATIPNERKGGKLEDLISGARRAIASTELERALKLLNRATKLNPAAHEPWELKAIVNISMGNPEAALTAAENALAVDADRAMSHAVLGLALSAKGATEEAEAAHQKALSIDPNTSVSLLELAQVRKQAGLTAEALDLYHKAAVIGPLPSFAVRSYAHLLATEPNRFDEAEKMLRQLLEEDPNDTATLRSLARLYLRGDRVDEGAKLLRQAAERTRSGERWTMLTSYLAEGAADRVGAIEASRAAIEHNATTPYLFWTLADALRDEGASPDEIADVAAGLLATHSADEEVLVTAGQIYDIAERTDDAFQAYQAAANENGASGYPSFLLSRLLARLSRTDEAETALRRALEIEGDEAPCGALKDLADIRVHRGDDIEATTLLEESLRRNASCVCSLVLLASVADRKGDKERAIELVDSALEISPHFPAALALKAQLSTNDDEAAALIESAVLDHPDDATMLLARARLEGRQPPRRIDDLERAIELDPTLVEARLDLVTMKAKYGDAEEALEQLGIAMQVVPTRMEIISRLVDAALDLARAGYGEEVRAILATENGKYVEPLIVALRLHAGEAPIVANEIMEVAADILSQLQSTREGGTRRNSV